MSYAIQRQRNKLTILVSYLLRWRQNRNMFHFRKLVFAGISFLEDLDVADFQGLNFAFDTIRLVFQ